MTFVDYKDPHTNANHSVEVPDELYDEGPDDHAMDAFNQLTDAQRDQAWKDFFTAGRDLQTLANQRAQLRAARQAAGAQNGNYQSSLGRRIVHTTRVDAHGNTSDVLVSMDLGVFEQGPPTGAGFEPGFIDLDGPTQMHRWADWLKTNQLRVDGAKESIYGRVGQMVVDGGPQVTERCMSGKMALGVVLGGLLVSGVGTLIGCVSAKWAVEPGDVTVTPLWDHATNTATVTVSWRYDTPFVGRTTRVTLVHNATSGIQEQSVPDAVRECSFTSVAPGLYTVVVRNQERGDLSSPVKVELEVKAPTSGGAPTKPAPATAVVLSTVVDSTTGGPALKVSWTAPATAPTSYTVSVGTTGATPVTRTDLTVTEALFTMLPTGSYTATVVAVNGRPPNALESDAATNATPYAYSAMTTPVPKEPRDLRLVAYRNGATTKPGWLVRWEAPDGAPPSTGYVVRVTGPRGALMPQDVGNATMATFPDLPDGAYTVSVAGSTSGGTGKAATTTGTFTAAAIPADSIDWDVFFDPALLAAWKKANDPFAKMDEDTFWDTLLAAVEDKTNAYGGMATYAEQLQLARTLSAWIDHPAIPPVAEFDRLATRLAASMTPPFPLAPAMPWVPYPDQVGVWKAAKRLLNQLGTAPEVRRSKLLAVARAIELHIASQPGHVRLYDHSMIPPERIDAGKSVQTAQRFSSSVKGSVNGVWWYRVAGDTGVNVAKLWKGTSEIGEASADLAGTGWSYLRFANPLAIAANESFVISMFHPDGVYGKQTGLFNRALTVGPLTSPASTAAAPNGLIEVTATPKLPATSGNGDGYFISPDFVAD